MVWWCCAPYRLHCLHDLLHAVGSNHLLESRASQWQLRTRDHARAETSEHTRQHHCLPVEKRCCARQNCQRRLFCGGRRNSGGGWRRGKIFKRYCLIHESNKLCVDTWLNHFLIVWRSYLWHDQQQVLICLIQISVAFSDPTTRLPSFLGVVSSQPTVYIRLEKQKSDVVLISVFSWKVVLHLEHGFLCHGLISAVIKYAGLPVQVLNWVPPKFFLRA